MSTQLRRLRNFTAIYGLVLTAELAGISFESLTVLHYLAKPLLMPTLLVFAYMERAKIEKKLFHILAAALFFCWLGDLFLMFQNENELFFLLGLAAFLIGHIGYIFAFRQHLGTRENRMKPRVVIPFAFVVISYAAFVFTQIQATAGDMLPPILVYMLVISAMFVFALLRRRVPTKAYRLIVCGALFFILSDSVIALNKFAFQIPLAGVIIMVTYALSQAMIVGGVLQSNESANA